MKLIREEFGHEYGKYRFGYTEHAYLEPGDDVDAVYASGFLPHSGDPKILGRFYLARSSRIPLADFELSSENRRIARLFDGRFETKVHAVEDVRAMPDFKRVFLAYFHDKHGALVMPAERLEGILNTPLPLRIVGYYENGKPVAFAPEVATEKLLHYWFPAYDLEFVHQSLGAWLMLDTIRRAKDEGKEYCYLGTVYGEKGRYKTNFGPLEFWDGSSWVTDLKLLKKLIAEDPSREVFSDRFNTA